MDKKKQNSSPEIHKTNANYILLEIDSRGNIIFVNDLGQRVFNLRLEDVRGRNIKGTIIKRKDDGFLEKIKEIVANDIYPSDNYFEYDHTKDNGLLRISWVFNTIYDSKGKIAKIICIGTNISKNHIEDKKHKQALVRKERYRIANEIHDTVSQTLFSLNLNTENLARSLETGKVGKIRKQIDTIEKLGNTAFSELRLLLYELKPEKIVEEDLEDLIKNLCESIFSTTGTEVHFNNLDGSYNYPYEVKFSIYRISQQAFLNIKSHADASRVEVTLRSNSRMLEVTISDNGIGFDYDNIPSNSFGINIMRERARLMGASLEIKSIPKKGTIVKIEYQKDQNGQKN